MRTDTQIQKDVMEELKWEPLLNANEIGVAVKNGIVTLTGTVNAFNKKSAAENATQRVVGVKAVAENILVKISEEGKRNDAELAQAVLNALKWHTSVPDEKLNVKVENGWATLEGNVEWEFQRNAAISAVESLAGVIGISNKIKIVPASKSPDIRHRIMSAFHRSATVDADKVSVEIEGSKVTLKGKVRSYAEKRDAENAAWFAPGVNTVDNKLEIDTEVFVY